VTTAIGLARLSADTDESTSIARQRQAVTDYLATVSGSGERGAGESCES
jgi:hypothetical protein